MNTFIVFFVSACLVTLALADDPAIYTQQRKDAAAACQKELNAADAVLTILDLKQIPTTEEQSCFLNCVYSKIGLIKDGKLNHEAAMALAMKRFGNDQEKIKKAETAFTHCQGEVANVSDEQCGRAKAARKCILEHSDDLQLFNKSS